MKKATIILIAIAAALTASAQGEWKWAHSIGGGNGPNPSDYYNQIFNTAFDDDGNIYIYGSIGGDVKLDGNLLQYTDVASVLNRGEPGILLAKFDTLGNMLWYKVIKSTEHVFPKWMEVHDNKVFITGNLEVGGGLNYPSMMNSVWVYYLDTLARGPQMHAVPAEDRVAPFKSGRWTFVATLDLDGNLLEDHFVEVYGRQIFHGFREELTLFYSVRRAYPFHVDRQGNTYFYTPIIYKGSESMPYTIIVDGDSSRKYDIYLPGSIDSAAPGNAAFWNAILYKFSPDWKLVRAKLLVDHVEGAYPYCANGDDSLVSFDTYYKGLSYDEEDNMYLSGYLTTNPCLVNAGSTQHHYPVHYYWDSIHRLTVHDITSALDCCFLLKYDTAGNVVWSNQLHTKGWIINWSTNAISASAGWFGNTLHDHSVYVLGDGFYYIDDTTKVYFDDESNPLQRFTEYTHENYLSGNLITSSTEVGFFARFDKETGAYINHGIVPAGRVTSTETPGVAHNRVFAFSHFGYVTAMNYLFTTWRDDGLFLSQDTVTASNSIVRGRGVMADEQGHVVTALMSKGSVYFPDDVTAYSCGSSNMVLAMYYNPEFAEPYVGIPDREDKPIPVKIWPNPTAMTLNVECESTPIEQIAIQDMTGRELLRKRVGDYQDVIDVSSLPEGLYLMKVVGDGRILYEKFIKSAQ